VQYVEVVTLIVQLVASWSKDQWIANIREAAAKQRVHISEVINVKKQKDEEFQTELESMISQKEVTRLAGPRLFSIRDALVAADAQTRAC
jgi:hypothetical protein